MRALNGWQFTPAWREISKMPVLLPGSPRDEPMLFGADLEFARRNGGLITNTFLTMIGAGRRDLIVDSKVVMLMAGMWPCIPGWHHDDVDRGPDGQPDYDFATNNPIHYMMHVGGGQSNTEFIAEPVLVPKPPAGSKVYRVWDNYLNALAPRSEFVSPGSIVQFDSRTFHRGSRAKGAGWRFWIRASEGSNRKPVNEIRKQVQVYMDDPSEGW